MHPSLLGMPPLTNLPSSQSISSTLPAINAQQWDHLNSMFSNSTLSANKLSDNIPWLPDSSASRRMTSQRHCLLNVSSISPCYIGLPNGSHTIAVMETRVVLGPNFVLSHVLFILDLTCNLLSISQ